MTTRTPLRVIVVDDQPAVRKDVKMLLQYYPEFTLVGACASVKEALGAIPKTKPHLLLLDISLGDGTGFDLLERLLIKEFKVIFLTAYEEHALRALKIGAIDYLVKPLNEVEFKNALHKVLEFWENSNYKGTPRRIILPADNHLQVIDLSEIMYCQSEAGYTTFFIANGEKIITSKYLKEYEAYFSPGRFIRTHQSFVVNVDYIHCYKDASLVLKNGMHIPVASRRKELVINSLPGH